MARSEGRYRIERVLKIPLLGINEPMRKPWNGPPNLLSIDTEGSICQYSDRSTSSGLRPETWCTPRPWRSAGRRLLPEIMQLMADNGYAARGGSFVNTYFRRPAPHHLESDRQRCGCCSRLWGGVRPAVSRAAGKGDRAVHPGSATDILGRLTAEQFSASTLGRPFVVENRPGAGGIPGTEAAKSAPPDGYTLIMCTSGPFGINPAIYSKLPYDPLRDFEPIANLGAHAAGDRGRRATALRTLTSSSRRRRRSPARSPTPRSASAPPATSPWRRSRMPPASSSTMCRSRARAMRRRSSSATCR